MHPALNVSQRAASRLTGIHSRWRLSKQLTHHNLNDGSANSGRGSLNKNGCSPGLSQCSNCVSTDSAACDLSLTSGDYVPSESKHLHREAHIQYLLSCLQDLPSHYVAADTSRWVDLEMQTRNLISRRSVGTDICECVKWDNGHVSKPVLTVLQYRDITFLVTFFNNIYLFPGVLWALGFTLTKAFWTMNGFAVFFNALVWHFSIVSFHPF